MSQVNKVLNYTSKSVGTDAVTSSVSEIYNFSARGNQMYSIYINNLDTANALSNLALYGKSKGGDYVAIPTDIIYNIAAATALAATTPTFIQVPGQGYNFISIRGQIAAASSVGLEIDAYEGVLPPKDTIGSISSVGTLAQVTNVVSLDTVDVVTSVANIVSLDTVDSVTLVAGLTTVGTLASVTSAGTIAEVSNITSLDTVDSVTLVAGVSTLGTLASVTNIVGGDTVNNQIKIEEQSPEVSAYSAVVNHLAAVTADTTSDYYPMVANGYGCGHIQMQYTATAADTAFAYLLARVDSTLTADTLGTVDLTSTAAQTITGTFEVDFPYANIAIKFDAGSTNGTFSANGLYRGGR